MKQFLIIEYDGDRHEDIQHLVTGTTFSDALEKLDFAGRIAEDLSQYSHCEAFPPTRLRDGKVVTCVPRYKAPRVTAYEIVGEIQDAQELLDKHVTAELVVGIAEETKRRK
jgi:hypothetical protein